MKNLFEKIDANLLNLRAGTPVLGKVIFVNPAWILLELPNGASGIILKKELDSSVTFSEIEKGTEIEATIIDPEDERGLVVLSMKRASQDSVWAELNKFLDEKRSFKVKIFEANKGGLMARYKGMKAFLPVSQLMPMNYPRVDGANSNMILSKLQEHIGKEFVVCVINVNRENDKIIISEKAANEEAAQKTLQNLREGDRVKGEISGIMKFGIFITFGGVEGLVHLSELDWGLVTDPSKKYKIGEKIEATVLSIDGEKLSLSIKRLTEDPWLEKVKNFAVGQKISGKISRWNSRGVFIEIAPDVQGNFDLTEFGVESANDLNLQAGDEISGEITEIDFPAHKIILKKIVDEKK